MDLARELKKTVEHENDNESNRDWCSWYNQQMIGTGTGGRVETIQTTELLRSVRKLRRVLET